MKTLLFGFLCFILLTNRILVQAACSLGVNDRDEIPDYRMQASSEVDPLHGAEFGRLDETPATAGNIRAIWAPKKNELGEWIQVDLGRPRRVAGITIQGRGTMSQWVTSYTVGCLMDDDMLVIAGKDGKARVFPGNTDRNTKITNLFDSPITCRYVRIYPQTYYNYMSLRFDVIGTDC